MIETAEDRAGFLRVIREREVVHPLTAMRYESLGWLKTRPGAHIDAAFGGMSQVAFTITDAGQKALTLARTEQA